MDKLAGELLAVAKAEIEKTKNEIDQSAKKVDLAFAIARAKHNFTGFAPIQKELGELNRLATKDASIKEFMKDAEYVARLGARKIPSSRKAQFVTQLERISKTHADSKLAEAATEAATKLSSDNPKR